MGYQRQQKPDKLIRDPADWARDAGWVSRIRAERAAGRLRDLASIIDGALDGDEGAAMWVAELKALATYLAPKKGQPS